MGILHVTREGKQNRKHPNLQHQQIEPIHKWKPKSCPETIFVIDTLNNTEKDRID